MTHINADKAIYALILAVWLLGCDPLAPMVLLDDEDTQGIYGIVTIYPGACLEDPENPGECLNKPFPGQGSFDVRHYDDKPDLGFSNPILKTFESQNDGWFKVELPTGRYCIWWLNGCQAQVDIEAGKWSAINLGVFLP
jgi:hypothetical protein